MYKKVMDDELRNLLWIGIAEERVPDPGDSAWAALNLYESLYVLQVHLRSAHLLIIPTCIEDGIVVRSCLST